MMIEIKKYDRESRKKRIREERIDYYIDSIVAA